MKGIFNREFIESLAKTDNTDFSANLQESVLNVVSNSIYELSTKIPFISQDTVIFQPANETFNGAFTSVSEYVYLLGLNSPQIEMNCLSNTDGFKKFWQRVSLAWKEGRRKSKKRKKKEEELKKQPNFQDFEPEKYNLESFLADFQSALCQNLSETTLIYNSGKSLIIQGKDDFGYLTKIVLIPVILRDGNFKYFIDRKRGFLDINFSERAQNFEEKNERVGQNFNIMLKLFNNVFKNVTKQNMNQIFIESLLFNIPDDFFDGDDIYQIFLNIINYLNMKDLSQFVSIDNKEIKLNKNPLIQNSFLTFMKFLNKI